MGINAVYSSNMGGSQKKGAKSHGHGDKVDIVGILEINSFNGIESIQFNLKDIMKSL